MLPLAGLLVLLNGCGSGSGSSTATQPATPAIATGVTTFQLNSTGNSDQAALLMARPTYHVAPVILPAPDGRDGVDNAASARQLPVTHYVPSEFQHLSSKRLTLQTMQTIKNGGLIQNQDTEQGVIRPLSSSGSVTTYTPAQIRAAYGMPALPASGSSVTATQAAALGAGQTVYIIDANDDPNSAAELAAFNSSFGLPVCSTVKIASNATLPLAAAGTSGCQFSVVYSTANATMSGSAPAYDSGWATEIALDVQWVHATAPMARIVLIEAPDASNASLVGAIQLANAMGPGAVSMSFGAAEGSWVSSYDSVFTAANMIYLAATGDSGTGVQWPAVSSHVVAVGGTSLTYTGSGSRSEIAWSLTGGGISAYVATPSYQTPSVPDLGSLSHRAVPDVAFNADPNTGQYLAVMSAGSSSVSWLSAGGTSLATPQWAGTIAIANAQRALAAKSLLGDPHAVVYTQIATSASNYASAFLDVTSGADGSCSTCSAHVGYDESTGLGTPNSSSLLTQLSGAAASAPVVTPATINGTTGTALSFTVSVTESDPVTYSLSGQPSGMTISSSGAVSWATPVTGSFSVTVSAKDTKTGLTGSAIYTIVISAPTPPVVSAQSASGKSGTAFSYTVAVTDQNPLTYSLTKQPSGMTISSAGVIGWTTPVVGTYSVTVTVKDTKTGLSGSGNVTITIATAPAPVVSAESISGVVGSALSFNVTDTASDALTFSLSSAPSGMTISSSGLVSWATPVAGTYAVTVTAKDTVTGLTGSGIYTVNITTKGPAIVAQSMTGKVGSSMSGTITITDTNTSWLSVSIGGAPMGMTFSISGLTITATWANPVQGNYVLQVAVVDSSGLSAQKNIPVTVTAH